MFKIIERYFEKRRYKKELAIQSKIYLKKQIKTIEKNIEKAHGVVKLGEYRKWSKYNEECRECGSKKVRKLLGRA